MYHPGSEKTSVYQDNVLIKVILLAELLEPKSILYGKPRPLKIGLTRGVGRGQEGGAQTQVQLMVMTLFLEIGAYGPFLNTQTSLLALLLTPAITVAAATISS